MRRDQWDLPQRNANAPDDLPVTHAPQFFELRVIQCAEAVTCCDTIEDASEPRQGVGQGAIEVEDGEAVFHAGFLGMRRRDCRDGTRRRGSSQTATEVTT